jgi:hypothetical protein
MVGLLAEIERPEQAARAVGERLRRGERLWGIGHPLYPDGDPRAVFLFERLHRAADGSSRLAVVDALLDATRRRGLPPPNVDLALAALAHVAGMTRGAGEAIFAVARVAGWLAHALEEYQRDVPFRPRALYTGPSPSQPPARAVAAGLIEAAGRSPAAGPATWRGPGRGPEPTGRAAGGDARTAGRRRGPGRGGAGAGRGRPRRWRPGRRPSRRRPPRAGR